MPDNSGVSSAGQGPFFTNHRNKKWLKKKNHLGEADAIGKTEGV